MLNRSGATLVELLVATTLAAVVLGAATSTFARQRRSADDHLSRVRAEAQVRAALGGLQVALEGLSASAGDLVAGEARDTAIQLRIAVANGVGCDSRAGSVALIADDTSAARANGFAVAPRVGDTLWWRTPGATGWLARRVSDITTTSGLCAVAGAAARTLLQFGFTPLDTIPRGAPIRLTRPERFSFYRAGDGSWQLGESEWSDVLHAFAPPQPIAGPFTRVGPDGARTGFRYFDASSAALSVGMLGVDVARVTRVRVSVIAPERTPSGTVVGYHMDSLDVALRRAP